MNLNFLPNIARMIIRASPAASHDVIFGWQTINVSSHFSIHLPTALRSSRSSGNLLVYSDSEKKLSFVRRQFTNGYQSDRQWCEQYLRRCDSVQFLVEPTNQLNLFCLAQFLTALPKQKIQNI